TGLFLALDRPADLVAIPAGVDGHDGLLVGEQQPVAILFGQLAPGAVDVVAERGDDVAEVLPVPRGWPRGDRALADRLGVVGNHRLLGDVVHAPQPVTLRARALGGVGR